MSVDSPGTYISENREQLVELTGELLAIESENPPGDTRAIVDRIEQYLEGLPVERERHVADPVKPNLVVRVPGDRDQTLLYNGHTDTVPFDADEWSRDPLGERVDQRIYGRGATDMKGPLAAMLFAIRALTETATNPPVDLVFAIVSDEEVGGDAGLPSLLKTDQLAADACVIGEPTCQEDRYSVTVADRGSIWLTLQAEGEAAHGSRPVLGENAIDRLYGAVKRLHEEFGGRALPVTDAMEPIVAESVDFYAPTMGEETAQDLFRSPSVNLGTIKGGDAINSVPQSARAEIDIRLLAGVQTPEMLSDIRDCVAGCDGITIADVAWSVGTAERIDSPLVSAVTTAAEDVSGKRVFRRSATGGGDAKTLRNAGIPTVEFAFGTDTVHAVDEYITVDALAHNAIVYAQLPALWAEKMDRDQ